MNQNQSLNSPNIYNISSKSDLYRKVDTFKAEIRNRFHQNYFQRVRNQIKAQQMECKRRNSQLTYDQNKYSIILNDNQQLFPPKTQINNTSSKTEQISTYEPKFDNLSTFTSLSQLANLYNWLHDNSYRQKSSYLILHTLMNKILQELQSKIICLQSLHQSKESSFHPSETYNENCNILFMLVIVYRQLQNLLTLQQVQNKTPMNQKNQQKLIQFYRKKLMQICQGSTVIDYQIMGMLGISNKAIQY